MKQVKGLFAERFLPWGFALAAAAILVLPAVLMPLEREFYKTRFPEAFNRWVHNGAFSYADSYYLAEDIYPYSARIRHAGTHFLPGDPYIKENKSPSLISRDFLVFFLLGRLYQLCGEMSATWVAAQFLFSAGWVLGLYALGRQAGLERGRSIFAAVALTLFADLTRSLLGWNPEKLLKEAVQYAFWLLGSYRYDPGPTRITRPLCTYPFLFLAGWLFVRADSKRTAASAAAAGLAGGALAYVHPDCCLAYGGASLFYTLAVWWRERRWAAALWSALAVSAVISLPWVFLNGLLLGELSPNSWPMSRWPDFGSLLYPVAGLLGMRILGGRGTVLWIACLLIAMLPPLNAHVVLGWQTEQAHWRYFGKFFSALLLIWAGTKKIECKTESWRWLAACALLVALPRAVSYSAQHYRYYALPRWQEEAFDWLEKNSSKDRVVAALSPLTNLQMPVHTDQKTLLSLIFPLTSNLSPLENGRRLAQALALFDAKPQRFLAEGMDASGRWGERLWLGEADEDSHERSGLIMRYFFFYNFREDNFKNIFYRALGDPGSGGYEVDLVWYGPFERAVAPDFERLARKRGWPRLFENSQVALFQVHP